MGTPARYDQVADFYEQFAPDTYSDPPSVALLHLIGDVGGLRVLDLACGHGRVSRELARRGASVVGVDLSAALLAKAAAYQTREPLPITYVHGDAASTTVLAGEQFDSVVCHFGLSDIDDLPGVTATVARVLRPGGCFTCSLVHPCFPGWESTQASPSWQPERGYYVEGWWQAPGPAHGLRPKVGAQHRMLSTYLNTFVAQHLSIEELAEPAPASTWLTEPPASGPVPVFLVIRCRRMS